MELIKMIVRKNFRDLSLVEMEHKNIFVDCILISCIFGIAFGSVIGPLLEFIFGTSDIELVSFEYTTITLIAWIFSLSTLFWAWRFAAHIRRKMNKHIIKWKLWLAYLKGKNN